MYATAIPDEEKKVQRRVVTVPAVWSIPGIEPPKPEIPELPPPIELMFKEELKDYSEELKTLGNDAIESTLFVEKEGRYQKDVEQAKEKCQSFLDLLSVEMDQKELERKEQGEEMMEVQQESRLERFRRPDGLQLFMKYGEQFMIRKVAWYYKAHLREDVGVTWQRLMDIGKITEAQRSEMACLMYKEHQRGLKGTKVSFIQ